MTRPSPPSQPKPVKTVPNIRKLGKRLSIQNTSPVMGLGCIAIWFRGRLVINLHLIRWMICLG